MNAEPSNTTMNYTMSISFYPHTWWYFCCSISSKDKRPWLPADNCLKTCNYTGNNLGHIDHQWLPMMWSKLFTPLTRITVPGDQADVHTAIAFLKASATVLQNTLTWTAQQQFRSGLPLIFIKNSKNLGVQSSQVTGKEIKKSSCHFLHSTSLKKIRWDWICIWLKLCYKKVPIPSSIASAFQEVPVMTSSVEPV